LGSLEPLLTYRVGNELFGQSFFINQNGVFLDLNAIGGTVTVKWFFVKDEPNAPAPKVITWTGVAGGVNNNKATFSIIADFFDEETDYDCDIEVTSTSGLVLHTKNSFIVRVSNPAGST